MLFLAFNPLWALFIGVQLFFIFAALFFLFQSKLQKYNTQMSKRTKKPKHYIILLYTFLSLTLLSLIANIVLGILCIVLQR